MTERKEWPEFRDHPMRWDAPIGEYAVSHIRMNSVEYAEARAAVDAMNREVRALVEAAQPILDEVVEHIGQVKNWPSTGRLGIYMTEAEWDSLRITLAALKEKMVS